MNIAYPFHFDATGHTAGSDDASHVNDMIEEFLFTSPGERVNRPDFGCGLMQLVFAPNGPELAAAVKFTVQAGLQRYLGDLITIGELEITAQDATLSVFIQYYLQTQLASNELGQITQAQFTRTV